MTESKETTRTIKVSPTWLAVGVVGIILLIGSFFGWKFTGGATWNNADDATITLTTTLQNFKYSPDIFTVKKGQLVTLSIDNKDNVDHGLHLPQFGIVEGISPFSQKTVQFVAVETPTNGRPVPTCTQEHGETLTFNVV